MTELNSQNRIMKVSFEEAKNMIDSLPNITIADVREESEFITGHVENAVNLPLTELVDVEKAQGAAFAQSVVPDKTAPLMVYCRTGKRSAEAAQALAEFGYQRIIDMGGLARWPYGLVYD